MFSRKTLLVLALILACCTPAHAKVYDIYGTNGLVKNDLDVLGDAAVTGTVSGEDGTFTDDLTASGGTSDLSKVTGQGVATSTMDGFMSAPSDKTTDYTLTGADSGKTFTNSGASGATFFYFKDLPVGFHADFVVATAQPMTLSPNEETTFLGMVDTAGDRLTSATVGATLEVIVLSAGSNAVKGFTSNWADSN